MIIQNIKHLSIACIALLLMTTNTLVGQEFRAQVKISAPNLQNADPKSLERLEAQISDFYNNTSFTSLDLDDEEKIEFNLTVFIKEDLSPTSFKADFLYQSLRPVYGSDYTTQVMNTIDKDFTFTYTDLQPIQMNSDSYTDPLSSLCTFYAYVILGYDFDSFSEFGGDDYFRIAQNVVLNVPQSVSGADGAWASPNSINTRSRYVLIDDVFNPKARELRKASYIYHLKGLDVMSSEPEKGLIMILNSLGLAENVEDIYPNSMAIQMFTDAKINEILEIIPGGAMGQKKKAYNIMVKIDPYRTKQYEPLNKL